MLEYEENGMIKGKKKGKRRGRKIQNVLKYFKVMCNNVRDFINKRNSPRRETYNNWVSRS